MTLEFHPVTAERWPDFIQLFEARGGPSTCWCTAWRPLKGDRKALTPAEKKEAMADRAAGGIPIGILVYESGEPVGWCSIAPRESCRPLGGDDTIDGGWSVVCFFIRRSHRGRRLASRLLEAAVRYAAENGARVVEGYPVAPDSPSYRFMGFIEMFEKAGFRPAKSAGKRRQVMHLALE